MSRLQPCWWMMIRARWGPVSFSQLEYKAYKKLYHPHMALDCVSDLALLVSRTSLSRLFADADWAHPVRFDIVGTHQTSFGASATETIYITYTPRAQPRTRGCVVVMWIEQGNLVRVVKCRTFSVRFLRWPLFIFYFLNMSWDSVFNFLLVWRNLVSVMALGF